MRPSLQARTVGTSVAIPPQQRYIIDGHLRRVPPYDHTYRTYTKRRWIGRNILDVFTDEFRDKDASYYKKKLEQGLVTVNGEPVDPHYVLNDGDLIVHTTHKHEPPVSSQQICIVHEDEELIVVDKPGGLPAHPAGRFKFNSVVSILAAEHGVLAHPCNRLDRLTSGLMFMAKTPQKAEAVGQQIRDRTVAKEYLARVQGIFPVAGEHGCEDVICAAPLRTVRPKLALNMVDFEDGKDSMTTFRRLSTDDKTSIVRCRPHTGRTHQIRVHLQYLGYPIANDPLYSNPNVWTKDSGKGASVQNTDVAALGDRLDRVGKSEPASSLAGPHMSGEILNGELCDDCGQPLYTDPGPNDLGLWLHAVSYAADDNTWAYKSALPSWVIEESAPFMKVALEAARKSPPLPTNFSVGACLVINGKVAETGYTNELPGNTHAEQCALQKYRDRVGEPPLGTEIYTTMEPCSLRLSGNLPCTDRILETKGITSVFVGVVEPGDFVQKNTGRAKLEAAGLQYVHIPGYEEEALAIAKAGHISN